MTSSYTKHLRILETIALEGRISSYKLSTKLGVSVSHAQWWLQNHPEIIEVDRDPKGRRTVWYGLSMIGFLLALKRRKVEQNFTFVFENFLNYQSEMKNDPILKRNMLNALKSNETAEKLKQFYMSISKALDNLTDIYSLDDATVVELATLLAFKQDKQMYSIFRDLYLAKVGVFRQVVKAYREVAENFDKLLEEDTPK
ncbi:MAG: hypothetical protein ACLPY5_14260 [Candidatus Bathyarchaeia archaeon]